MKSVPVRPSSGGRKELREERVWADSEARRGACTGFWRTALEALLHRDQDGRFAGSCLANQEEEETWGPSVWKKKSWAGGSVAGKQGFDSARVPTRTGKAPEARGAFDCGTGLGGGTWEDPSVGRRMEKDEQDGG